MGVRHIIKDIDASALGIGYSAAVPYGLRYINFFGGDYDQSKNLIGGSGVIIGNPTSNGMGGGISLSEKDKIDTQIIRPKSLTVIAVVKFKPKDQRSYVISDADNSRPIGFTTYLRQDRNIVCGIGYKSSVNSVSEVLIPFDDASGIVSFSATVDLSNDSIVSSSAINLKTNFKREATKSDVISQSPRKNMIVGAIRDESVASNSDVMMVAVYDRVLSDDEIKLQYAQIKKYYANVHSLDI